MTGAELLRLRCRGHPEIRATHHKTLELTADADITGRATCVVGVAGTVVGTPPPAVAGPVVITVSAGGHTVRVRALANSAWRPGGAAVVRRSADRLPGTLATDADLAAADLPRAMVAALSTPDTEVNVVVCRDDDRAQPRLVLYRAGQGEDTRLAAECVAAHAVLAEDGPARQVVTAHGATPTDAATAADVLAQGGRVLAVSTVEMATRPVRAMLAERPVVEVLGMPPELAVAAVSPHRAPVLVATGYARREVVELASAHGFATVVFRCPARELPRCLDAVHSATGRTTGAVVGAAPAVAERPVWGPLPEVREPDGSGDVLCAVDPVGQEGAEATAGIVPAALITALAEQGVSARTIAHAMGTQPGWSKRQAYDLVLKVTQHRPSAE